MFFFTPTNEFQSVISQHVHQSINQSTKIHNHMCLVSTVRDLLRENGHPTISKLLVSHKFANFKSRENVSWLFFQRRSIFFLLCMKFWFMPLYRMRLIGKTVLIQHIRHRSAAAAARESLPKLATVASTEQHLTIAGKTYDRDSWTNITPHIISHIGRNIYAKQNHPLWLIKERIVAFFHWRYLLPWPFAALVDRSSCMSVTCLVDWLIDCFVHD